MSRKNSIDVSRVAVRGVACLLAVGIATVLYRVGCAEGATQPGVDTAQASVSTDAGRQPAVNGSGPQAMRSGGLLEQSFNYRGQPQLQVADPPAGYARAGGWYGYGFPVQSYRWGYFGAERNYPRVIWHTGYYGDCIRTAYRYGH